MSLPYDPWKNMDPTPRRKNVRRSWRAGRNRVAKALLITGLLYALYTLIGGGRGIVGILALGRQEAGLKAEIAATDGRVRDLDRKIENLGHTIEEEARRNGYVGRNEWDYEISEGDSTVAGPKNGTSRPLPDAGSAGRP